MTVYSQYLNDAHLALKTHNIYTPYQLKQKDQESQRMKQGQQKQCNTTLDLFNSEIYKKLASEEGKKYQYQPKDIRTNRNIQNQLKLVESHKRSDEEVEPLIKTYQEYMEYLDRGGAWDPRWSKYSKYLQWQPSNKQVKSIQNSEIEQTVENDIVKPVRVTKSQKPKQLNLSDYESESENDDLEIEELVKDLGGSVKMKQSRQDEVQVVTAKPKVNLRQKYLKQTDLQVKDLKKNSPAAQPHKIITKPNRIQEIKPKIDENAQIINQIMKKGEERANTQKLSQKPKETESQQSQQPAHNPVQIQQQVEDILQQIHEQPREQVLSNVEIPPSPAEQNQPQTKNTPDSIIHIIDRPEVNLSDCSITTPGGQLLSVIRTVPDHSNISESGSGIFGNRTFKQAVFDLILNEDEEFITKCQKKDIVMQSVGARKYIPEKKSGYIQSNEYINHFVTSHTKTEKEKHTAQISNAQQYINQINQNAQKRKTDELNKTQKEIKKTNRVQTAYEEYLRTKWL
ncbi:Hypothetical_protein [Hexamita inflata]|uniref:Hypothetical_protein n=1 Tax=Hexamita inflata TaxID=28002 RepID=A0AA86QKF8_9EUKA|nr:Hypothetical protein HINF_LOCUS45747 [Hexamita inflata]